MATKKTSTKKVVAKASAAEAISAPVHTVGGKKAGTVSLPGGLFGLPWNASLVHQVVTAMQANARPAVAHVKDRGEVRGGGKKPWKQKGTGRSRHGSSRSPIWIGGGVTHGPRNEKIYAQKINKKMRTKALFTVLSQKVKDNEVLFVDSLSFAAPKAKEAKEMLSTLAKVDGFSAMTRRNNAVLVAVPHVDAPILKSFRNFGNVTVIAVSNLNPVEVLRFKHLLIASPDESVALLEKRSTTKNA